MIEMIGFDADDTLWENEFLYQRAKRGFVELLSKSQEPGLIAQRLDAVEVANIRYYGYGIKSFGLSMIETAIELYEGQITPEDLKQLIQIVKEMLMTEVPLADGVNEILADLSARRALMLITKGDLFEQERKIERSGLAGFFKYIEVLAEKTEASYLRLLEKYGIDPGRFLMVGNSMRSDILPILRLGGQAVYIPNDQTWFHEQVNETEIGGLEFGQISSLGELPGYLRRHFS